MLFPLILIAGTVSCLQNAAVAPAAAKNDDSDWKSLKLALNESAMEDFYDDASQFGELYWETTKKETENVKKDLLDAFEDTAARLVMNFGKTVVPLVKTFSELTSKLSVNAECNQDCAAKCFDAELPHEDNYFDKKCMAACGCVLDMDKMNATYHEDGHKKMLQELEDIEGYANRLGDNFLKIMKPSVDAYVAKKKTLEDDFFKLLKKHAVEDLGCDPKCISDCTNQDKVSYFELPDCLEMCMC